MQTTMQTNITKAELIELDACEIGLDRFIRETKNTDEPVEILSLIGGENTTEDLLWLAVRLGGLEQVKKFALNCAALNVEKIKPYCHPNQYELILNFLNGEGEVAATSVRAIRIFAKSARAEVACSSALAVERAARVAAWTSGERNAMWLATWSSWVATSAISAGSSQEKIDELLKQVFLV